MTVLVCVLHPSESPWEAELGGVPPGELEASLYLGTVGAFPQVLRAG